MVKHNLWQQVMPVKGPDETTTKTKKDAEEEDNDDEDDGKDIEAKEDDECGSSKNDADDDAVRLSAGWVGGLPFVVVRLASFIRSLNCAHLLLKYDFNMSTFFAVVLCGVRVRVHAGTNNHVVQGHHAGREGNGAGQRVGLVLLHLHASSCQ